MSNPDSAEREDPRLQVDPALMLSCGRASAAQIALSVILAIVIVVATGYALVHQGDLRNAPALQTAGAVLPDTIGPARR